MKIHIETDRLIMRDLVPEDAQGMFELDSDPEVHAYLGNQPIKTIAQAKEHIDFIRQQYVENGIGRWAVIEKHSGQFMGWSGFKLITDMINERTQYLDLGYRFIRKYWGKGFATESANASLEYGFKQLKQKEICAMADVDHKASNNTLKKIGMKKFNEFNFDNTPHNFYEIKLSDWRNQGSIPPTRS